MAFTVAFEEPDEPLAGERTDLAWTRSGIAFLVCVAVMLRRVWPIDRADHLLAVGLVAIGAGAWAVALVVARRVARTTHGGRAPDRGPRRCARSASGRSSSRSARSCSAASPRRPERRSRSAGRVAPR